KGHRNRNRIVLRSMLLFGKGERFLIRVSRKFIFPPCLVQPRQLKPPHGCMAPFLSFSFGIQLQCPFETGLGFDKFSELSNSEPIIVYRSGLGLGAQVLPVITSSGKPLFRSRKIFSIESTEATVEIGLVVAWVEFQKQTS